MQLSIVVYNDHKTRMKSFRKVPNTLQPTDFDKGIFVGPPDLSTLHFPKETALLLNNALVDAGYMNYTSLAGRRRDLLLLIQSTLAVSEETARDIRNKVTSLYQKDYFSLDEV